MYLAISIFLLVLITESILFGTLQISNLAYEVYKRITNDVQIAKQTKLKTDMLKLKAEFSQTSSQDEFAKWAKLRRKLDKGMADLEKLSSDINYKASAFELVFKSILFAFVYGSQTIMMFWFRKSPVFYLPPGWFGPAQRFLSLPFAPAGSVSVAIWFTACKKMIRAVVLAINDFVLSPRMTKEKTT